MDIEQQVQLYRDQLLRQRAEAGPVFIRHRTTRKTVDVEIVQAADAVAAQTAPVFERRGYFTDERVDPDVKIHGPYDGLKDARGAQEAWTEDI